ncbi:uncharacterized protein EV154DRAFT_205968 [Mucor mucedo]|uniref:uncharacterized protein n=1 Tax=Mucor mucedo TaxID=29922 RepID=UPI00221FE995|nr:uncharacterized protein EV154DRAFT_205968 [Mucor mucedo]KAI7891970.1 hypothetical protein EV154DRAFT_205968 [Mucor mucedo]
MNNKRTVDQETELTAIAEIQPVKKETIESDIKQSLASAPPSLPNLIDDLGMTSFLASLRPVPGSKKWTYENRDMVKAWTIFKAKCAGATIDRGISIKDDIQSLLALSHIFYIKSSDNSQIMNDYFQGPNKLFGIRQDVRRKIGLENQYTFQGSAQLDVIKTIENLLKKNTGKRKIAASEVLNIAVNLPEDEYLILSELVSMINYLPRRPVTNVADQHCITEYANPILRPIFENVNAKRKLKWTKKDTLQQVDIQAQVHLLSSQSNTSPLSIGKVTHLTGDTRHDKLKISADLIQLAIDSKKNIDTYSESSIRDVTFFHVVGFKVTIYIMSLLHEGLYAMLDIAEINIPQSIEDLVPFVNNLEASITASRVFKHCSSKENKDIVCKDYFRPTLSTRKFDQLVKPLPSPTKRTF